MRTWTCEAVGAPAPVYANAAGVSPDNNYAAIALQPADLAAWDGY